MQFERARGMGIASDNVSRWRREPPRSRSQVEPGNQRTSEE